MEYTVGSEIEAWCGQCKVDRRCSVSSLNADGSIDRVTCTYCQTSRNYRQPQGERVRTSSAGNSTYTPGENGGGGTFEVPESELDALIRKIVREETEPIKTPMGERWNGGKLIIRPGKPGVQDKEIPLEQFFKKIVMLRDRLRVLEQQINSHDKLDDADKVQMQQYITRCYGTLTTFNMLFREKEDYFVGAKSES